MGINRIKIRTGLAILRPPRPDPPLCRNTVHVHRVTMGLVVVDSRGRRGPAAAVVAVGS